MPILKPDHVSFPGHRRFCATEANESLQPSQFALLFGPLKPNDAPRLLLAYAHRRLRTIDVLSIGADVMQQRLDSRSTWRRCIGKRHR